MDRDYIFDELRRVELAVVEGERQLAEKEALLVELKKQNQDLRQVEEVLQMIRENQQRQTPTNTWLQFIFRAQSRFACSPCGITMTAEKV